MVLEATMICIDNSEWMRNGDYSPTRFQAQADAVNLICGAKTQSNPENTVGVLTMAGKGVRVLVTPTSDLGKILACMHGLEIGGEMNLAAGIQVAQLALKHRQNKKQQQRIIVFAGGPVNYDKKVLEMIGRKLKKNSVALDVVNFGEEDAEKAEKLDALVAAVNNNDSSHIVHIPAGPNALSDVLLSTPIFTGDGEGGSGFAAAAAAAAAGGVSGFDFGVDPNLDPELALALRVSMEEERARQEAAAKKAAEDSSKQEKEGESTSKEVTMAENVSSSSFEAENKKDDLMISTMSNGNDVEVSSETKDTEMLKDSGLRPNIEDVNYRHELRILEVYEMSPPNIIAQWKKDELGIPLYPIDDEDEHPKQDPTTTIQVSNGENVEEQEQIMKNVNRKDIIDHELEEIEEEIEVEQVQEGNHVEVLELIKRREQEEESEEENDFEVSFDSHKERYREYMHEIEENRKVKRKAEQRIEELERGLWQIKRQIMLESISLARDKTIQMATQARDYVHNFLDWIHHYLLF